MPATRPLRARREPNIGADRTRHNTRLRISGRRRTAYPAWLKIVALAIVVANAGKMPALVDFALARAAQQPELGEGLSTELFLSAIRVGTGVVVIFSTVIGCVVLYATTRYLLRRQGPDKDTSLTPAHLAIVLGLSIALVLPDVVAWFGNIQPAVDALFWALLVTVVGGMAWAVTGPARSVRSVLTVLAVSVAGVFL